MRQQQIYSNLTFFVCVIYLETVCVTVTTVVSHECHDVLQFRF